MPRWPIHVPYLVNRVRTDPGDDGKRLRDTVNAVMEELHRYLRYLQNTSDQTQLDLAALSGVDEERPPLEQPIRNSLAFAQTEAILGEKVPRNHSHPHVHGPEDVRLTYTEGVLPGQIFGD